MKFCGSHHSHCLHCKHAPSLWVLLYKCCDLNENDQSGICRNIPTKNNNGFILQEIVNLSVSLAALALSYRSTKNVDQKERFELPTNNNSIFWRTSAVAEVESLPYMKQLLLS